MTMTDGDGINSHQLVAVCCQLCHRSTCVAAYGLRGGDHRLCLFECSLHATSATTPAHCHVTNRLYCHYDWHHGRCLSGISAERQYRESAHDGVTGSISRNNDIHPHGHHRDEYTFLLLVNLARINLFVDKSHGRNHWRGDRWLVFSSVPFGWWILLPPTSTQSPPRGRVLLPRQPIYIYSCSCTRTSSRFND